MNAIEKFQLKQALTEELIKSAGAGGAAQWYGSANQRIAAFKDRHAGQIRREGVLKGTASNIGDNKIIRKGISEGKLKGLLLNPAEQDRAAKFMQEVEKKDSAAAKGKTHGGKVSGYLASVIERNAEKQRLAGQRQREKGFMSATAGDIRDIGAVAKGVVKGERPAHTMTTKASDKAKSWWKSRREAEAKKSRY